MLRKITLVSVAVGLVAAVSFGFTGCTSLLGDYEALPPAEAGAGKANGQACGAASECSSSFCADGVCCESACSGVCETCSADKGRCTPIPEGVDPEGDCKPEPLPDAGTLDPDAGALPADAGDAAVVDDGGSGAINFPDGGVTDDDAKCAGSCNGARACKFPGKATACGSKFCNASDQAARYVCNGKGRCDLDFAACTAFTCKNDQCRTTCAAPSDCQSTHFCNTSGVCQERLANGIACTLPDQCKSGFCVVESGAGVCCNSACDVATFGAGATCKSSGNVGRCKCSINCGTGSCRLYYKDGDGDGFGDPEKTALGCDNAPPPAGYVADKTDCDDGDARAKPGQTGWFADTTLGKGLNDFNCDGVIQKETREYPGSSCQFCFAQKDGTCSSSPTCTSAGAQSRLSCEAYRFLLTSVTCGYSKFVSNTAGFTTTVNCGATSSTYRTCGTCSAVGGTASFTPSAVQQRCH